MPTTAPGHAPIAALTGPARAAMGAAPPALACRAAARAKPIAAMAAAQGFGPDRWRWMTQAAPLAF
jgi:hypothetical protein